MEKVRQIVKVTGKIKFKYDVFIKGSSSSSVNSLFASSIGSIIRSKVKLSAENWEGLHDNEKKKLTRGLSVRSAANTINRGKNESEHHAGRLPIIYRVVHHKEKGEEFPVIPTYEEIDDIANDPKAALKDMHRVASEPKDVQKNAKPEIPELELPPLSWSDNIKVLEPVVGRRTSKEVCCLGRAAVQGSSSSTRPAQIDDDSLNIAMEKARIAIAEENSKRSEEATQELKQELALVKEQLASFMVLIGQQSGFVPQVPSQQPLN